MQKQLRRLQSGWKRVWHKRAKPHAPDLKKVSRHPSFMVPAITFGVLALVTGVILLVAIHHNKAIKPADAKIVIVSQDSKQQVVPTKEPNVGALLEKMSIRLNEGDVVEPALSTKINQDQFRINIYRAMPVEVVDGAERNFTFSAAKTPRSMAQQSGVGLYPEDIVKTTPTKSFLQSGSIGEQVIVKRATPVNVDLYGTPVVLRTQAKTVGALMKEKNIKLTKNDRVSVPANTPITADAQIAFIRTGSIVKTVTEEIAMPTQTISDASLAYGTSAVRQQGSAGQQVVTYQIQLVNNVEVTRNAIQTVVNKQPVAQIVVMGTSLSGIKGDMALAGIAPGDYQYVDYIISHESGWCPTKAQGQYGGCPAYAGSVPSGGGYGLCQSTPGSKMASAGADWATNPVTQLKWCSGYATSRYGSWQAAYNHWLSSHNW